MPAESGAESGAHGDDSRPGALPADLAEVAAAWPTLPADVRRTILHVVRATPKSGEGTV
jgi:hypothetical protein